MTAASAKLVAPSHPLRAFDYFALNVYWFALSYLWNSMGPIILPVLVASLVPEARKGSALGLITALGLIIAVVVQPAAGAWSDRRNTRWGRRRPYLVSGTLFDALFLAVLAFSGSYEVLLIAYILLQFSSNIAHGPYQGYIPQLVPQVKRGRVSGIARLMEIIGVIVTSLATGHLVGEGQIAAAIGAIILFLILSMAITAIFVTEEPFDGASLGQTESVETRAPVGLKEYLGAIFYSRDFFLWLLSRLFLLLGGNLVRNYALFFMQDVLRLPNPAAEVGSLLAVIGIAIALVVFPAGSISDRWGRKTPILISGALGAIGSLLLLSAGTVMQVLIYGGIMGIGIGIYLSVSWAWASDLIPAEDGGRYLGISNLATAGSGVLAAAGGFLLDYFNAQAPNRGYTALFLCAGLCYIIGTLLAVPVKETRKRSPELPLPI